MAVAVGQLHHGGKGGPVRLGGETWVDLGREGCPPGDRRLVDGAEASLDLLDLAKSSRGSGPRVAVPCLDTGHQPSPSLGRGDPQACGAGVHLGGPGLRRPGCDDVPSLLEGGLAGEVGESFLGENLAKGACGCQRLMEGVGAMAGEHVGRVQTVGEGGGARVEAVLGE